MHVLLVGKDKQVQKIYQEILVEHGIQATIAEEGCRIDEYDVVLHLWPMSAFLLDRRLRAVSCRADDRT